jgi:predicted DNA-binding transcriptional regulator YafY
MPKSRAMNKPAMMDYALRLLRLLNERRELTSRVVAEEFDVDIRTAQRYLLHLSLLPCVVVDEKRHVYSLTSDYVFSDKILNASEMTMFIALVDYATHIFGAEHSKFLAGIKAQVLREPGVYRIVKDEAIDLDKVADVQVALERFIKTREAVQFDYQKSGKRYTVEPYRILYHGGFWYLVGGHAGLVKKWNLDMIGKLRGMRRWYDEISEETREAIDGARSIWFNARPPERVTVEFDAEVGGYFLRKGFFPGQVVVEKLPGGGVVLSFDVHSEMDLREQLARWMPHFRVTAPGKYRDYVASLARRTVEKHTDPPASS